MAKGGLKLLLEGVRRDDRRVRFARVTVSSSRDEHEFDLVTDSCGRLAYRLPAGAYRLRVADAAEARFAVGSERWTTVRLRLP
jgi:hypothetical protein